MLAWWQALQVAKNRDFPGQDEDPAQNPQNAKKYGAPRHGYEGAALFLPSLLDSRKPHVVV